MSNTSAIHTDADLALTVLLQSVAAGRRVLWIGDAASAGAQRMTELALDAKILDTSGQRLGGRFGSARVSALSPGGLSLDGAFDLAVVSDGDVLDDLPARIGEIRAAVGDGVLALGVGSDGDPSQALAALRSAFREVRLLGQAPFAATSFADLETGLQSAAVDGTLMAGQGETIARYVLVAGDELPEDDGLLVVQLPGVEPVDAAPSTENDALRDALIRAEHRLEQAQVRLVETEAELAGSRAALQDPDTTHEEDLVELEAKLRAKGRELAELRAEAGRRETLVRDITEELREWTLGRRGGGASALDTEAALAAAEFTIDELRTSICTLEGQIAEAEVPRKPTPNAADSAPTAWKEAQRALEAELAALRGERDGLKRRLEDMEASAEALAARQEQEAAEVTTDGEGATDQAATAHAHQIASLRGERDGLEKRLHDVEASWAALAARNDVTTGVQDRADNLQDEVDTLRRTNSELTLTLADLTSERDNLEGRGRDASAALAARDALITRLQMDLAQEENASALEANRAFRLQEEITSLRAAIVDASSAVDEHARAERALGEARAQVEELQTALTAALDARDAAEEAAMGASAEELEARDAKVTELEGALSGLKASTETQGTRLKQAESERDALVRFRKEAQEALQEARVALGGHGRPLTPLPPTGERSTITAVGVEAPTMGESADKDTLLRSLTAQLEERDDRIRAYERRLQGEEAGGQALELEERVTRLQEALEHERAARRAADERVVRLMKEAPAAAPDAVQEELRTKKEALEVAQRQSESLRTDVASLRTVCERARTGLESLLADADADEEAARRIGQLLDVLQGF